MEGVCGSGCSVLSSLLKPYLGCFKPCPCAQGLGQTLGWFWLHTEPGAPLPELSAFPDFSLPFLVDGAALGSVFLFLRP